MRVQWPAGDAAPAFDAREYAGLIDMIGGDGAMEMVWIFETETRERLRRLAAGGQDTATLLREMHTLKGAADTVAAPRLTGIGRSLEQTVKQGGRPGPNDLKAIQDALEAYLAAVRG